MVGQTKTRLCEIGKDVASVYGGEFISFSCSPHNKKVSFICIEHGERFIAEMSFDNIKTEYDLDLSAIFNKKPE